MTMTAKRTASVWATSLPGLLLGEDSCEWAGWFKARHFVPGPPTTPAQLKRRMGHRELLSQVQQDNLREGRTVLVEDQNRFDVRGRAGTTLSGRPDLIISDGRRHWIVDVKSGFMRDSHRVQMMIYMWAVPRGIPRWRGHIFEGKIVYPDEEVLVSSSEVDEQFVKRMGDLIRRLASPDPPPPVPSARECGWCSIQRADCPVRIESSEGEATIGDEAEEWF